MKKTKNKKPKVIVAMSGGVDSSVSAALLKKAGFDVVGIMLKFWKDGADGKNRCCSVESEKLARIVAKQIGIPFYVINAEKEFKKAVVDYFLDEYRKGNTPNPCVVCNKEIKFGLLIDKALKVGGDFVATGHYIETKDGKLFQGKDKDKDQSYFLWQLNEKQISKVMFPVGEYTKPQVRKLAKKFKLSTAQTPESQEVCFIEKDTNEFLKKYLKTNPGKILDMQGKVLGSHQGLWFYTIGQRKGLEIPQGPYYAVKKDYQENNLIVSKNEKDLDQKEFFVENINWISPVKLPKVVDVKIRYKSKLAKAEIFSEGGNKLKVVFKKAQRAVTPGQSAVFYKGKEMLGGGIII
jgi:tRNA-specific 2-thiouridylase